MEKWEGKIRGYDQFGCYIGTYTAVIEKQGDFLYKMTLSFNALYIYKATNFYLKQDIFYSSSLGVLKKKFRDTIVLNIKSKIIWTKRFINY